MWKYLAALLVVLLSLGGLVVAQLPATQVPECTDCYANIITQQDTQTIQNIRLGTEGPNPTYTVAVGNEGLTAGIIVTKAPVEPAPGAMFAQAPFARIDQKMDQTVSNLGDQAYDPLGEGAKGITWNKAIQAAWMANQGVKELEGQDALGNPIYAKEGSYIGQDTTQLTDNVYDYALRDNAKVLNVDNKLAMVVDDVNAVLDLTANAGSTATDTQSSTGTINNNVGLTIGGSTS